MLVCVCVCVCMCVCLYTYVAVDKHIQWSPPTLVLHSSLLSKMLVRDPKKRASLQDILNHHWLTRGDPAPLPLLPLISWEHLTPEEHSLIISKMVARKMATKEEILRSVGGHGQCGDVRLIWWGSVLISCGVVC